MCQHGMCFVLVLNETQDTAPPLVPVPGTDRFGTRYPYAVHSAALPHNKASRTNQAAIINHFRKYYPLHIKPHFEEE